MRVAVLSREYPPEVYGGAGVHVEFLVRELRRIVDVDVHCFGGSRPDEPRVRSYAPPVELLSANAALQTLGVDLEIAAALGGADVLHSHTWYANLAGVLGAQLHGVPHVLTAHSLEPQPAVEGRAARRRLPDLVVGRAAGLRDGRRDRRGVLRHARRRPGRLPVRRPGAGARHPQRHRHRAVRAGGVRRRARASTASTRPAVRPVRRPDHPAEGPRAPARGRRALRPGHPAGAVRRRAGHRRDRGRDRGSGGPAGRDPHRRGVDPRDAAPPGADPAAHPRQRVRLPVGVRAAGHRQPRGDGLRDGGGGQRGRRHPRGRRRRAHRAARAACRGDRRGVRGRPGRRRERAVRRPGPGRRRMGKAGRERAVHEFGWDTIAHRTVELYEFLCPRPS